MARAGVDEDAVGGDDIRLEKSVAKRHQPTARRLAKCGRGRLQARGEVVTTRLLWRPYCVLAVWCWRLCIRSARLASCPGKSWRQDNGGDQCRLHFEAATEEAEVHGWTQPPLKFSRATDTVCPSSGHVRCESPPSFTGCIHGPGAIWCGVILIGARWQSPGTSSGQMRGFDLKPSMPTTPTQRI
jgi:hypothetical protein